MDAEVERGDLLGCPGKRTTERDGELERAAVARRETVLRRRVVRDEADRLDVVGIARSETRLQRHGNARADDRGPRRQMRHAERREHLALRAQVTDVYRSRGAAPGDAERRAGLEVVPTACVRVRERAGDRPGSRSREGRECRGEGETAKNSPGHTCPPSDVYCTDRERFACRNALRAMMRKAVGYRTPCPMAFDTPFLSPVRRSGSCTDLNARGRFKP